MKQAFLFIILIVPGFLVAFAQMPNDWGAFSQRVDAAPYIGKKFRLQAAVKVQVIDSSAEAEVWMRVDKAEKKMGFFNNMMDKPIRLNEWKIYTISGKVDKNAIWIYFGGLYHRKGIFYFDDFKLFVETEKNKWEQVNLPDGGFESDTVILRKTWGYLVQRNGFTKGVTESASYEGKRSFKIDGSSFIPEDTYGNNSHTGKFAKVNGINIYYEVYGQGEPLLLLHGNSCSISLFEKQIPELSKKYKVIAVDTRGQGKSSEDGKTYTYDLFAEDMNALLDHLNLDSVNIVGWSDGGNTGLIMAMRYPVKVKKLVTMGANVFIDKTVVSRGTFNEVRKLKKEFEEDSSAFAKNRLRLLNLLVTEPNHSFEDLKKISCPALVVAGEKDIILEEHTKGIAANIPKSTLMIVPKATHYFPSEDAKAFNKAVIDFFEK